MEEDDLLWSEELIQEHLTSSLVSWLLGKNNSIKYQNVFDLTERIKSSRCKK
jgi:hypothetical protein